MMSEKNTALDDRQKRLLFRACRRGSREADSLVGGCAEAHIHALTPAQMTRFEALVDQNDPDLMAWISGTQPVPPMFDNDIMALLKKFKNSR